MHLEGYKSKAAPRGISGRVPIENPLPGALGEVASLPGAGAGRLEGRGPYFGVSRVILEVVHCRAERVRVGAQDRHGKRRTMGRMRSWEAVEKTSFAPAAPCRAPGMKQIRQGVCLPRVCASTSWNTEFS